MASLIRMGRLSSDQARSLLGALNSPFNRSRGMKQELDASELLLERDPAPQQSIEAPELAPIAHTDSFDNPYAFPIRDELKYSNFINSALLIGAASTRILLAPKVNTRRVYLQIINSHATQTMSVSFGQDATTVAGVPLAANFGFVEYNVVVPQDDIYIIASGAGTTGVLVYSNATITAQR